MSWWKFWQDEDEEETPDYYREGVELMRAERYHEALTHFRLAKRERPEDSAPLEQMGVVYQRIGVTDEAIKVYREALERNPNSAGAHYGLGFLLLERGREEEAERHLEAFLDGAPSDREAARHVRHAREKLEELRSREPSPDAGGSEDG